MSRMLDKNHLERIVYVLIALAAMLFISWATPWGVRIGSDSYFYLTSAESFVAGDGLFWQGSEGVLKPLNHFPPVYPLVLAFFLSFNLSLIQAANVVAILSFGMSAAQMYYLINRYSCSRLAAILGAVIWILSPVVISISFTAMTEMLFTIFALACISVLADHFASPCWRNFFAASGLFALACLTRYAGMALLPCLIASILLLGKGTFWKRTKQAVLFAGLGLIPYGLWSLRNFSQSNSLTNRTVFFHPISLDDVRQLLTVLTRWYTSVVFSNYTKLLFIGCFVLFSVLALILLKTQRAGNVYDERNGYFLLMLGLFAGFHILMLFISKSFFDASTQIDNRILFPVYLVAFLTGLILFGQFLRSRWKAPIAAIFGLALIGYGRAFLPESLALVQRYRTEGKGFFSRTMQHSLVLDFIREQECGRVLVTNNPEVVYLHTGCAAVRIPEPYDPVTLMTNDSFSGSMDRVLTLLQEENSFLILMEPYPSYMNTEQFAPILSAREGRVLIMEPASP